MKMTRLLFCLSCFCVLASFRAVAADPGAKTGLGPSFKGPVGLQLYSLRADFAKDVPGTLEKVRSFGIKNVELAGTYDLSPEKFKQLLDSKGLKPISTHFPYDRYRDDLDGIVRDAKTLGVEYAGCA